MPKRNPINPYSITFESIQNDLRYMISTNQTTFTDFFDDASGSSVVDVAASLGAFFAYHVITRSREFSLEQATNYKSLIGNAYDKGYNVKRGTNVKLTLTVTPNTTGSLSAWTTIGSVQEYDVVLLKNVVFTKGIQTEIEVVIGNRGVEGKTITTNKSTLFRFTSDDITDDIRLFLDNKQVEFSTSVSDLLNDKYLVLSNSYGSVNVFYLNTGVNKYSVGSVLAIDYITKNNLTETSVSASEFYLDEFTVDSLRVLEQKQNQESKDSIRVGAALHAETAGLIKSRTDFKKVIQEKDDTIESISDEEIQPGRIGIMVLKKDREPLTDEDKARYNKLVANNSVTGVANLYYTNAHKYDTPIQVSLIAQDETTTSQTLLNDVENRINKYEGLIGETISFNDIESYIEKELTNIKTARISVESKPWEHRTYRYSDTCIASMFNNKAYYVAEVRYLTGDSEPNWDNSEQGYIVDNHILWKEYNGDPEGIMIWKPHVNVKLGKLCVDKLDEDRRVWEAVGYLARTGAVEPDWSAQEQIIFDNEIIWSKHDNYIQPTTTWDANKILQIGDSIEKIYNNNAEESYEDKTQYSYFGEIFGGTFYTKAPLDNTIECYSDETFETSIGIASDIDKENKTVTITPLDSSAGVTGTYLDMTTYKYLGGVTGNFYTQVALAENVECFSDSEFNNSLGKATTVNTSTKKVLITQEKNIMRCYYRVADFAVTTGEEEPDWEEKTTEGYIEDGNRIRWKETSFPIQFISLANNTYADFQPSITMN